LDSSPVGGTGYEHD
jgi:hypothetical protein